MIKEFSGSDPMEIGENDGYCSGFGKKVLFSNPETIVQSTNRLKHEKSNSHNCAHFTDIQYLRTDGAGRNRVVYSRTAEG